MKRDKTSDVEVLSNLGADRLSMGIDPDGMVHVTDLLTNAYSDEELAVLREYATNARDSHKAAGQTRPIEVTLPIAPWELPSEDKGRFLRIQDWGLGLSTDEIANVFAFYGKSTKDSSDEFTGMMGIGGKSGLIPRFGSFTITGIKDGQKTVVAVGRNEATEPVMDLVSVNETDEPNGVTIEVPVPRRHGFVRKAANFFQFWPEGSVLVDGKAPDRLEKHMEVTPMMWVTEEIFSSSGNSDWIVMGDVPYPVNFEASLKKGYSLVVYVPIGTVSIAISREALRMTDKTKDAIARLRAEYDQAVKSRMQSEVSKAKTRAEAVRIAVKWRKTFAFDGDFTVKFGKTTLPTHFEVGKVRVTNAAKYEPDYDGGLIIARMGDDKKGKHDRREKIYIGALIDQVLVSGYPVDKRFQPGHKEKLEAWAKSKGFKPEHFILTADKIAHGWIDSKYRVEWESIKKVKVTSSGNGPYAVRGTYPMYVLGEYKNHNPAQKIDTDEPIFWMDPEWLSECSGYYYERDVRSRRKIVMDRYPTATFVELTSNRVNKFKRDFPQARHARVIFDEIYEDIKADFSLRLRKRFAIEADGNTPLLRKLDHNLVDDPALKKAIRWSKTKFDAKAKKRFDTRLKEIGRYSSHDLGVEYKNPIDKYPLASSSNIEHTILYLNAAYAAGVNNK